jgi:CDP-6-deoxy-D-xylo-4-hexulose-3-dehydrase
MIAKRRIPVGYLKIGKEERKAINDVLDSGRISEGPRVLEFEREWAKYIGTKYCVAVNSGTSALMAALYTLDQIYNLSGGDVLTHKITFVATHNAIRACGFNPIFKGKADIAIPVHLMGYPQFLKAKYVIEDASQAHGSLYKGKRLGSFGLMGCFSFYIAHNIQAGEMGAVVTDDYECYRILKKIKAHGRVCDCLFCVRSEGKCPRPVEPDPRFTYDMFGLNFKTMEFQAALALCQIKKADWIMKKRQDNVEYLNKGLKDLKLLTLPKFSKDISYLAYPIICDNRREIREQLEQYGIESRPLFNHPKGFYIGVHQYLTKKDLDYAIQIFHRILYTSSKR